MMLFQFAAAKSASSHHSNFPMKICTKTKSGKKVFNFSKKSMRVPRCHKKVLIKLKNHKILHYHRVYKAAHAKLNSMPMIMSLYKKLVLIMYCLTNTF